MWILGLKGLKECFCTCLGSKQLGRWLQVRPLTWGYAMLMIPNEDETAVHGCHCQGDIDVCMCEVLAIWQSWYMCFSAEIGIAGNSPALHPLPTHLPFTLVPPACPSPSSCPPALHPLATHLPFTLFLPNCCSLPICPPALHPPPTCPLATRHSTALHSLATHLPFTLFLPNCPSPSSYPTALHSLATHLPFAPSPLNCPSPLRIPAALHSLSTHAPYTPCWRCR